MRSGQDFGRAVRKGRRAGSATVVVHLAACDSGPDEGTTQPARIGFVVSRAVGCAVVRNRVKRRLRAALHERLDLIPPGALLVVRALPAAGTATGDRLRGDLDRALNRTLTGQNSITGSFRGL
jgi:ribonuclease P protein component